MASKFVARATISISVSAAQVWEALTKPELIKQYLFGTEVATDWQVGSPITYRGEWQGKPYEDKGKVLQIEPEKLLVSTFWSSLSGQPDLPAKYKTVRYELFPGGGRGTNLTVTQDNNDSQEEANHSEQNWNAVLQSIKKLLEK